MNCLICESDVFTGKFGIESATIWRSYGNYGSSLYDPLTGDCYLEAVICDSCLRKKKKLLEEVVFEKKVEILERKEPNFG
jgi:hypothetical protein